MSKIKYLVLLLLVLSITVGWNYPKPATQVMCTTQMMGVYAEPNKNHLPFYALTDRQKVWWAGVRTEHWLFVDYAQGSGWIETADFRDCPADVPAPNPLLEWVRKLG